MKKGGERGKDGGLLVSVGFTGGDDVRHSSAMLELGKHMKITMAVKMEHSVKWHILGRRGKRRGEKVGVGGAKPERIQEGDSLPDLWRMEEGTRRRENMCRGEGGLSPHEEQGQRPTADPEEAEATKEKISQEGEKESTAKKRNTQRLTQTHPCRWSASREQAEGAAPRPPQPLREGRRQGDSQRVHSPFSSALGAAGLADEGALGLTLGSQILPLPSFCEGVRAEPQGAQASGSCGSWGEQLPTQSHAPAPDS